MNTDRLVDRLARDLRPAHALRGPWARAAWWLVGAMAYLALLALLMTSWADVAANRNNGWTFPFSLFAAIATAAASAVAAFASTVPGVSNRMLLLPVIAASIWGGTLLGHAVDEWTVMGAAGLMARREWLCVAMIVLGGAPAWLVLVFMLRQGAPLAPRVTAALGALSVAAMANVAACVSHPHPSSLITLVWHGSTILAVIVLAASAANHLTPPWEKRHRLARGQ